VQDREAPRAIVGACEQEVLATDRESPFILPMLASLPWCTTDGTRSPARRSGSRIASIAKKRTSPYSRRRIAPARCCRRGCSMLASARR
jgi:hypothetical protein